MKRAGNILSYCRVIFELLMEFMRSSYDQNINCANDAIYAVTLLGEKMCLLVINCYCLSQCGHFKHELQCSDWIFCIFCSAYEQWIVGMHTTVCEANNTTSLWLCFVTMKNCKQFYDIENSVLYLSKSLFVRCTIKQNINS